MRIGDRARFETESREASEFDSPSHRCGGIALAWSRDRAGTAASARTRAFESPSRRSPSLPGALSNGKTPASRAEDGCSSRSAPIAAVAKRPTATGLRPVGSPSRVRIPPAVFGERTQAVHTREGSNEARHGLDVVQIPPAVLRRHVRVVKGTRSRAVCAQAFPGSNPGGGMLVTQPARDSL